MNYDEFTESLWRYPESINDPKVVAAMSAALGLVGEAGETADKIKKWHRDGNIVNRDIALELGDTLYYLTRLANIMGYSLEDIIRMNIEKLESRRDRKMLHGSGDNR